MFEPRIRVEDTLYTFGVFGKMGSKPFTVVIKTASGHNLVSDEPQEYGGENQGPNPVELLLSSIASCFIISLWINALKEKVVLNKVEVLTEGSFDIRGFIHPELFPSGMKSIVLKAYIEAASSCDVLENLINRTVKGWIVGSTVAKAVEVRLELELQCLEQAEVKKRNIELLLRS